MTFKEAKNFLMPIGIYAGKTIDKIAETNEGLKYLDWMREQNWIFGNLKIALDIYLKDPVIKSELDKII